MADLLKLDDTDWDGLLDYNVDSSGTKWKTCFLHIMSQCIPEITIKSERRVPLVTHVIQQAICRKEKP